MGCEELTLGTSPASDSNCISCYPAWVLEILATHVICQYLVSIDETYQSGYGPINADVWPKVCLGSRASFFILANDPGDGYFGTGRLRRVGGIMVKDRRENPDSDCCCSNTLGLYEDIVSQAPTSSPFHYLEDRSVFGKSTPPRNADVRFSRICGGYGPMICPGSSGSTTWYKNASGEFVDVSRYNTSIPLHLMKTFQSGLSTMQASVSSIFDIQSRYTSTSQTIDSSNPVDNGTGYPVSQLRPIQSLITDRGYHLVEGLVIDMQVGGLGFRNHTAPPWRPLGSEWSEDLLFIEPVTRCVDLNLTIDYQIAESLQDGNGRYTGIALTDRGGFSNLSPFNGILSIELDDSSQSG